MNDYNVRWRSGDAIVEATVITARSALQAARAFAKAEELTIEVSSRRLEGATIVWSVRDRVGHSVGAVLVI